MYHGGKCSPATRREVLPRDAPLEPADRARVVPSWYYYVVQAAMLFVLHAQMTSDSQSPASPLPRRTETVLVVDDDELVRRALCQLLERQGYTVLAANDGEGAVELLAAYAGALHLVIADIVMPGLTGRALLERLAAGRPPFKVLFMSGYPDYAPVGESVREAGVAFLEKPFPLEEFTRTVRGVLDDDALGRWMTSADGSAAAPSAR